ncbi:hypothetical protein F5Y11DRAFT_54226 [Daldinia sp. FL1419]|nr:hypothetical protein F5Y11DRAFT_54226 [Daldinia sp. FL1419]
MSLYLPPPNIRPSSFSLQIFEPPRFSKIYELCTLTTYSLRHPLRSKTLFIFNLYFSRKELDGSKRDMIPSNQIICFGVGTYGELIILTGTASSGTLFLLSCRCGYLTGCLVWGGSLAMGVARWMKGPGNELRDFKLPNEGGRFCDANETRRRKGKSKSYSDLRNRDGTQDGLTLLLCSRPGIYKYPCKSRVGKGNQVLEGSDSKSMPLRTSVMSFDAWL